MEREGKPTLTRAEPPGRWVARICPSRRGGKTVAANKTAVASTWYIFPYNFRHATLSEWSVAKLYALSSATPLTK